MSERTDATELDLDAIRARLDDQYRDRGVPEYHHAVADVERLLAALAEARGQRDEWMASWAASELTIAAWKEATGAELPGMARAAMLAYANDAARLAAVRALADEWEQDYPSALASCNYLPDDWWRDLRALLAAHTPPSETATEDPFRRVVDVAAPEDFAPEPAPVADRDAGLSAAIATEFADHDEEGWTTDDSDRPVYECQCGDRSPALDHDAIYPEDVEAAARWHRLHLAEQAVRILAARAQPEGLRVEHAVERNATPPIHLWRWVSQWQAEPVPTYATRNTDADVPTSRGDGDE